MRNENTVKYFTVKNCAKAGLKPAHNLPGDLVRGWKPFIYKDRVVIYQSYNRVSGVTLVLYGFDAVEAWKTNDFSRYGFTTILHRIKMGKDFCETYSNAAEIDISLFQEQLDTIIEQAEQVESGILPGEESNYFEVRLKKEMYLREQVLKSIVLPSDWLGSYMKEDSLRQLADYIELVKGEIHRLSWDLDDFRNMRDDNEKIRFIGSYTWPSKDAVNGIKQIIERKCR